MLPPGHISAGFLTAQALLKIIHPNLTSIELNQLLWWGMFFGFAPDLDTFVAFAKARAFIFLNKKDTNHRKFYSHAPVLWLIAGIGIMLLAPTLYWKIVGLLLWLGSWSHFFLDSIQYGIMWLWPLSDKIYAFKDREIEMEIKDPTFFGYWWTFVKKYSKMLSFYLELIIIISAVIIYIIK